MDAELIDDVFEDECMYNPRNYYQNIDTGLNVGEANFTDERSPSPTLYPGSKPPKDGLRKPTNTNNGKAGASACNDGNDDDDGWKSYKIEDDSMFDENFLHKVRYSNDNNNKCNGKN